MYFCTCAVQVLEPRNGNVTWRVDQGGVAPAAALKSLNVNEDLVAVSDYEQG
jgi:hypothetical protein